MCTVLRGGGTGLSHQIKLLLVETEEQLFMSSLSQEASPGFLTSVWGGGLGVGIRAELKGWAWLSAEGPNRRRQQGTAGAQKGKESQSCVLSP